MDVGHRDSRLQQLVRADLKEFVAGVRGKQMREYFAVEATRVESGPVHHLADLSADDGNLPRVLPIHPGGIQPEKPVLTDDLSIAVEAAHAHHDGH